MDTICENFYDLRNNKKIKVCIEFCSCFKAIPLSMFYIKKTRGSAWYKMFCNPG